jgi:transposase
MQLKTLLNRVEPHQSFVYGEVRFRDADRSALEVVIRERANGRPICSGCGQAGPGYDRLPERRYEFVPLWAMAVFLVYAPRRVACTRCGVKVERVPWAEGKSRLANSYQWFLASWAKLLAWQQVATVFHTSWQSVYRSVQRAVAWGLAHRNLDGIEAIGVDEVQWQKGHHYLTLVYQIDGSCRRLLHIAPERTMRSLLSFFRLLGKTRSAALKFVCSDMWQPYLKVIGERMGGAIQVLDRFHIMKQFGKALDEIRAEESKRLKRDGYEPVLRKSRWCLLKRPENLTAKQTVKLAELLKYNLRTVRAYLLREDFQRFWECRGPSWAGKFLDEWTRRVMRSRLEPLKKVARTLRSHRPLILNWFRAKGEVSSGAVEGLNNKVKLVTRKSFGFRTAKVAKMALLHNLGRLPEPKHTHRFC